MDIIQIVELVSSFVLGGGIYGLINLRSNKRKGSAEATTVEVSNLRDTLAEVRETCSFLASSLHEERENASNERILLNSKIDALTEKVEQLANRNELVDSIRCINLNCKKRNPPITNIKLAEQAAGLDYATINQN